MNTLTPFEQEWYDRYMKNIVTLETLQKLANAGKLDQKNVDLWVEARMAQYGI